MSKFCSGSFVYPDPFIDEEGFIQCLLDKIRELSPKMLLPTHDESVIIMRNRDRFPSDLLIPYESAEMLMALANKANATKLAYAAGVPTPNVYNTITEVVKYPVVFKTVIGNSAKEVYFPKNRDELIKHIEQHKEEETLIEEWVGGSDYSVDCVRWGEFWYASVYRALVTKTNGGGTTTQREIVSVPELTMYAKQLLDSVNFRGVCGLDFRYDSKSGRIAFLEVNARFTGGLATPIAAGFDIPWIIWNLATQAKYDEAIDLKIGTKTKWILGDIITFVGRLLSCKLSCSELGQVFRFNGFDAFDDFRMDDKNALLGEMLYYFEKLIKNRKLNP